MPLARPRSKYAGIVLYSPRSQGSPAMVDEGLPTPQPRGLKQRAAHEFRRFLWIFLYLWVVFALLSLHASLVLTQHRLDYQEHAFAIVNALVFAKVLLVGEDLHFGTRFDHKPLIYPILYKCFVFTLLLISFHIVETTAVGVLHGNTILNSLPPLLGFNPKGLVVVGVICFILLLPFFGFREIARIMGQREMQALLFQRRDGPGRELIAAAEGQIASNVSVKGASSP